MSSNNDSCFRLGENCIPSIVVTIRYRVLRPFGLIGVEWIFSIRCGKSAYALLIIKYLHCPKGIRKKLGQFLIHSISKLGKNAVLPGNKQTSKEI